MAYKKILAAVDLTEEAQQVLDQANETAKQNGAELSLVVVIKPINQVRTQRFELRACELDRQMLGTTLISRNKR